MKTHPADWKLVEFCDVFDLQGGTQPPKSVFKDNPQHGYVRLLQIRDFESDESAVYIPESSTSNRCAANDILVGRYGASLGRICTGKSGAYNVALVKFTAQNGLEDDFAVHWLKSSLFQRRLQRVAARSAQAGFSQDDLAPIPISLPNATEQHAIAEVLLSWDESIRIVGSTIVTKGERKRGLMDQLLKGKARFKEFSKNPWISVRIGDVLKPENRYEKWDDGRLFRLAGVRRNGGGLFFRDELSGSDIKVKVCKKINAGDFLISRRQLSYGGMAIVPPEFDGFDVNDEYEVLVVRAEANFDMRFFNYLSQTAELKYAACVASNGFFAERLRMNLDLDQFLSHKIFIPPTSTELQKIISVLDTANSEIELLEKQLAALKEQKRGLMQKLLTGEVRVKI